MESCGCLFVCERECEYMFAKANCNSRRIYPQTVASPNFRRLWHLVNEHNEVTIMYLFQFEMLEIRNPPSREFPYSMHSYQYICTLNTYLSKCTYKTSRARVTVTEPWKFLPFTFLRRRLEQTQFRLQRKEMFAAIKNVSVHSMLFIDIVYYTYSYIHIYGNMRLKTMEYSQKHLHIRD